MPQDDSYDPSFLAELERESEFLNQSGKRSYAKRIDLKLGESAMIRTLPYAFDDKKRFFARTVRHWISNRPYLCTKMTLPEHGGREDQKCEICDLVDDLNRSRDRKISDVAYKMTPVPQWLTFNLVYELRDDRGREVYRGKGADLLIPQENWLYKEPFGDLLLLYKNFLRKHPDVHQSITDPEFGCDLLMTKMKRGLRFEREDPQPIGKDPIGMLEAALKNIDYRPEPALIGDDLDDLLIKIEDACQGRTSRSDDRRGGGSRGRNLDLDEEDGRRGNDRGSSRSRDDRRAPANDDRRAPANDDRRSSTSSRRADDSTSDRRSSSSERRSSEDDRRPPADDRRSSTDDRRAPANDDRKAPADERRAPANDERRAPVDDRRSEPRRSSRDEPVRDDRRAPADDERRGSRTGREADPDEDLYPDAKNDTDLENRRAPAKTDDNERDEAPPPLSRSVERRGAPPPPPAAGRGNSAPPAPRSQEKNDDDETLPEDDKDGVPASEPKPGEVVDSKPADTPPKREFQSTLGSALKSRIASHQNRSGSTPAAQS